MVAELSVSLLVSDGHSEHSQKNTRLFLNKIRLHIALNSDLKHKESLLNIRNFSKEKISRTTISLNQWRNQWMVFELEILRYLFGATKNVKISNKNTEMWVF